jgi:hypothetical protein
MLARLSRLARTVLTRGLAMLLASAVGWAGSIDGKILRNVTFSTYGTYSSDAELTRRLLTPATAARLQREAASSGLSLAAQPLNLAAEKFIVYVPAQPPPRGYALLVFVPPWQQAGLPEGWIPVLDHYGAIYVSAARSGNDENTMGRREPLALLAAQNIMAQYPVDPERVYIAGFSGGSHIALRLALGYPDLFHGAILNAGSDAIGDLTAQPPVPGSHTPGLHHRRARRVTGRRRHAEYTFDAPVVCVQRREHRRACCRPHGRTARRPGSGTGLAGRRQPHRSGPTREVPIGY